MDLQSMSNNILVGVARCFKAAVQGLCGQHLPWMERASDGTCAQIDLLKVLS